MTGWLDDALARSDARELWNFAGRLHDTDGWTELADLATRCRAAWDRGHQLGGVAARCDYLLALGAPVELAAGVVREGAGRTALGPLAEVVAARFRWRDLAPHLDDGPVAAVAAHERVVRGEDLTGEPRADRRVLDLPPRLETWEPGYLVPTYGADGVTDDPPERPRLHELPLPRGVTRREVDPDVDRAFAEIAGVWVRQSNGRAEVAEVDGDVAAALAALGVPRARVAEVDASEAVAWLAWTAASGGAHGTRRGAAAGRFEARWTVAALAGIIDDWPLDDGRPDLGDVAAELNWFLWDAFEPDTGWSCRLAVEDPDDGLAWAFTAIDAT